MNGPFTQAQVNSYLPIFQEQTNKVSWERVRLGHRPCPHRSPISRSALGGNTMHATSLRRPRQI